MPDNNLNVQQILDLVRESNSEFASEVYLPSLQKNIPVLPMTASHLKDIIKTSVSGVFTNNEFNILMSEVLAEVLDPSDHPHITLYDKIAIIIQLRNLNVRSEIQVDVTQVGGDKVLQGTVYLVEFIEALKLKTVSFADEVIKYGSYEVTLAYPQVAQETLFSRYFRNTYHSGPNTDMSKTELKELFGPIFINEITQYIKSIKIKDNEIDFYQLDVKQRIQIVENLSSGIISHIIDRIDKVFGKQLNELLKVEIMQNQHTYTGSLTVDPAFFS